MGVGKIYIVHAVDTEGPLYESLEANFQRIKEHYGFTIEPSKKNLEKIRNHEFDFGGKESLVADIVKEEMINTYLGTWDQIDKMHETILRGTIEELNHIADVDSNLTRGEIVIVLEGSDKRDDEFDNKLDYLYSSLSNDLSLKQFSKVFSKISKQSAKEIYNKYKE